MYWHWLNPVGNADVLQERKNRQLAFLDTPGVKGKALLYKTTGPFVTGLGLTHPVGNGFAWHHILGTPYLPGSSVKGLIRHWAEYWSDGCNDKKRKDDIQRIFGSTSCSDDQRETGSVVFCDALPIEPVRLKADIMTPHYSSYYQSGEAPGDWLSPIPIEFLVVETGQTFLFAVLPRSKKGEAGKTAVLDCERVVLWLKEALDWIGIGAKTAVGYGRFEAVKLKGPGEAWLENILNRDELNNEFKCAEYLRSKVLAEQWQAIDDRALKQSVLAVIRKNWGEELWSKPQGRGCKKAKAIYDGNVDQ